MGSQHLRTLSSLAVLVAIGVACSIPDPPKSLRTLMLQQELAVVALERGATDLSPEELVLHAERVAVVSSDDEAFSGYESRASVRNRVPEFRALRRRYSEETDGVRAAAQAVDREALVAALSRLRATCDGCHAQFRPGLLNPR